MTKRDGSRQEFDRRKIASAIGKAATEDLTADRMNALIDDIEQTIRQSGASEVTSERIGQMVLERLAQVDPMTYIRFKIVYDRIADPDTLLQEVATLLRRRAEARDRLQAEQTLLPIAEPAPAARPRRRR